jgi:hypothetical protein
VERHHDEVAEHERHEPDHGDEVPHAPEAEAAGEPDVPSELDRLGGLVMRTGIRTGVAALALALATMTIAATNPIVGGKEMFPNKDIIDNAVNSADHTALVAAVKAAGLVDTLKGAGPFTSAAST